MKKITYYIFGLSVWVLFINGSCILWLGTTPCETPIAKTIGVNDSFSITPLKDSYNAGEKIIVKFTIASKARLYYDKDVVFDLFKKTNKNEAWFFTGYGGVNQGIGSLITESNPIRYIIGRTNKTLLYQPKTDSYVLELEVTLLGRRKYIIDGFELGIILGEIKPSNCHYYSHVSAMKFDPPISFEVK